MSRVIRGSTLLFILVAVLGVSAHAGDINSSAGTSAFSFLKINVGARPVGLGGAFTGLANDISSLYYNPAGIATLEGTNYILGYHNYFVDMQSGFLGYTKRTGEKTTIGGYISYLNYGSMTETDVAGNVIGDFNGGDFLLALSFARNHSERIQYGASAKFIYEKVHEYSATGLAMDLGVRFSSVRERYTAGLMVQNLGFQLSSLGEGDKESLPLIFRGGAAARPKGLPILFSGDVIVPTDNDIDFAIGGEYYELNPVYFRVGWNSFGSNYRADESDESLSGVTFGFGLDLKGLGVGGILRNAQLSYAYSPAADLGQSHRITLTGGTGL
jgi:hypothetical protein